MNFALILSLLKNSAGSVIRYWREILIAILIFVVIYQNTSNVRYLFFVETIPSLESRLEIAQNNIRECVKGNEVLANIIKQRNDEVLKWKDVSEKLQDKTKILNNTLDILRKSTNTKVQRTLNSQTPKNCQDAIQYLKKGRNDLKWPE